MRTLTWFRSDLRTIDCEPLMEACRRGTEVHACFLICAEQWQKHGWGPNRIEYTRRNLADLSMRLAELGIPLHIRNPGTFEDVPAELRSLVLDLGISEVHWGHEYEVNEQLRDARCREALAEISTMCMQYHDQVLLDPHGPRTGKGDAYRVFTPYASALHRKVANRSGEPTFVRPEPRGQLPIPSDPVPDSITGAEGAVDLADWPVGEQAALARLKVFLDERAKQYAVDRDKPGIQGTSRLSAPLAVGSLSPWTCLSAARSRQADGESNRGLSTWITELVWREFYRHVLVNFPHVCRNQNFDSRKDHVAWRDDENGFQAWCDGRTGIPIVDAAMRCLVATGWMHNRLRMVSSQFLCKHLLIDWRRGEEFFARHLVDIDFASNNGGWQWSASTGTDAAPYFRIFNPVLQGQRFDPEGEFTRRWVPELSEIGHKDLHDPWRRCVENIREVGYPEPIVDLPMGRIRAIEAFKSALNLTAT